jgi:hypothetical protein
MPEAARQRLFTIEEADELVPVLSALIERLQKRYRELISELQRLGLPAEDLEQALSGNKESERVKRCLAEITASIAEIESHGCHFKGMDLGLVDFPALINNELAYLCWQYGESHVSYWHRIDDGFAGRHPLAPVQVNRLKVN